MKYWKAVSKINKNTFRSGGVGGSETTEFKIGETYQVPGDPVPCKNGFHFYRKQDFVFGINLFGAEETEFIEIEPLGEIVSDTRKSVCCKIKVLRYVPKSERQALLKDKNNSGYYNSGDYNSGDRNSGNCNSGNCNSGDRNFGYFNSGNYNSGNCNSGNRNSGHNNSGSFNSGNCNSGSLNSGNYNSGNGYRNYACDNTRFFLFNIETTEEEIQKFSNLMDWFSLENKSYKEAWAQCPPKKLKELMKLEVLETTEGKETFSRITGLALPVKS